MKWGANLGQFCAAKAMFFSIRLTFFCRNMTFVIFHYDKAHLKGMTGGHKV